MSQNFKIRVWVLRFFPKHSLKLNLFWLFQIHKVASGPNLVYARKLTVCSGKDISLLATTLMTWVIKKSAESLHLIPTTRISFLSMMVRRANLAKKFNSEPSLRNTCLPKWRWSIKTTVSSGFHLLNFCHCYCMCMYIMRLACLRWVKPRSMAGFAALYCCVLRCWGAGGIVGAGGRRKHTEDCLLSHPVRHPGRRSQRLGSSSRLHRSRLPGNKG